MYQCLPTHKSTLQVLMLILIARILILSEGASISLSPLGLVSVCPGGQVLLTCERMSGSFLFWTVFVPRLTTRDTIVADQGAISATDLQFNGLHSTAFTVIRTSGNPLTSQMMVNVTAEMNGSTIYCSEDRNTNGAPVVTINVTSKDLFLNRLNLTLVNHFLRNSVTVTLQWPREAGAVYHVNVSPLTEMNTAMSHDSFVINLTISYNIQYKLNVSIVSNLCNATTTRVLKYVICDLPNHLLHDPVMVSGSQDSPPIEGQFITYTCPTGFILDGSNMSVCNENGEWEPDPGVLDCIADCGVPVVDRNVTLNYNSTLEGSVLVLICENNTSIMTCHSSGNWIPDPAQFSCSPSTTVPSGTGLEIILGSVLGVLIFGAAVIITASSAIILCLIKKGFLQSKRANSEIQLENIYHPYADSENSSGQPNPVVQQDTLVYADIGPSSVKKRNKQFVTLRPEDMDDRVEYALLNHSLQKSVITATNQDSIADDSLNLDTVLIQVRGAITPHWYQLGEALEVSKDVLDKCTNYPPEESVVEVLDQWLRNFPGHPTWRDVANALRKIGVQQLANDIEMVYETGKLPMQVDNDDAQQEFTTALELPQSEEDKTRINNHHQDESVPPLPPKPLAGSDVPKKMSAPPRPPKYVPK